MMYFFLYQTHYVWMYDIFMLQSQAAKYFSKMLKKKTPPALSRFPPWPGHVIDSGPHDVNSEDYSWIIQSCRAGACRSVNICA